MRKKSRDDNDDTKLVHAGREPSRFHGFVNTPIYRGSTILFPNVAALEANDQAFTYGRLGTPTVRALEEAIVNSRAGTRRCSLRLGFRPSPRRCSRFFPPVTICWSPTRFTGRRGDFAMAC